MWFISRKFYIGPEIRNKIYDLCQVIFYIIVEITLDKIKFIKKNHLQIFFLISESDTNIAVEWFSKIILNHILIIYNVPDPYSKLNLEKSGNSEWPSLAWKSI